MLSRTDWRMFGLAACASLTLSDLSDNGWIQAAIIMGCAFGAAAFNDLYLNRQDKRYHERQMRQLIEFLRKRTFDTKPDAYKVVMKVQEVLDKTDMKERPVPLSEFMLTQLRVMATDFNDDPDYRTYWRPR